MEDADDQGSAPHRVALYYAPEADDPLWRAGIAWLGRDPAAAAGVPQPDGLRRFVPDLVTDAAAYGLHATLKAPFRLADPAAFAAFRAAAADLARACRPFQLPPLSLCSLDGFLALCETEPSRDMQALADLAVAAMDRFRAPLTAEEQARRTRHGLSAAESAMLALWGYPHVFHLFRFHITLSRRLAPSEQSEVVPMAECHFAAALGVAPRMVRSIALFRQDRPGAPFRLAVRLAFGAA